MNILGLIDVPDSLALVAIVLTALYFHFTKNYGVFKALGVPGPKPLLFRGNKPFFDMPMNERNTRLREQYGQVYGVFMKFGLDLNLFPFLVVGNPEMVREITIKHFSAFRDRMPPLPSDRAEVPPLSLNLFGSSGDYWKTLRNIMTPTFTSGKLKKMVCSINLSAKTLVSCLKTHAEKKEEIVAQKFTGAFSLDTIASVTMGVALGCQGNPDDEFVKNAQAFVQPPEKKFFPTRLAVAFFPFLAPLVRRWTLFMGWKSTFVDDGPIRFIDRCVSETIVLRKSSNMKHADFLQLIQDAEVSTHGKNMDSTADQSNGFEHKACSTSSQEPSRKLSRDEIVAQCILFFVAGFDTTRNGLMYSFYNLALFPEIQDRLLEEINAHIPRDSDPDYEAVGKCEYLEMFLMETLRLYPSVPVVTRVASRDVRIGQYFIPKDTTVMIPIWQIHHDPAVWEKPELFDPERFHPDNRAKHHPAQWMPFGIGPRHCIGMRLALLVMKIALIHVIRQYKISKSDKTEEPVKLTKLDSMGLTVNPVHVRVDTREVV